MSGDAHFAKLLAGLSEHTQFKGELHAEAQLMDHVQDRIPELHPKALLRRQAGLCTPAKRAKFKNVKGETAEDIVKEVFDDIAADFESRLPKP